MLSVSNQNKSTRSFPAFVSFWLGIISLFPGLGIIFVLPAIGSGIYSLMQIKKTGQTGKNLAKTGIALAIIGVVVTYLVFSLRDALLP